MANKKELINVEPVFRLKPVRTDDDDEYEICEIKFIDYKSPNDQLGDEPVDIETSEAEKRAFGKNTHYLGNINGYEITVNVYRNNVVGSYLIKNRNIPVCSLQFMYAKNIVIGYLFNIFIYFCLDPEKNKFLNSPKSFVNARAYGKYIMVVDSDKEVLDDMNTLLTEKIQTYSAEDIATKMDGSQTDEQLIQMIQNDENEKKEFYKSLLDGKEVKFTKNMKKFIDDNLIPIYKNSHITGLIKFALDVRAKKRIKEYGAFDGIYKVPEKVLNLNDIKNNPDLVDEHLGLEKE